MTNVTFLVCPLTKQFFNFQYSSFLIVCFLKTTDIKTSKCLRTTRVPCNLPFLSYYYYHFAVISQLLVFPKPHLDFQYSIVYLQLIFINSIPALSPYFRYPFFPLLSLSVYLIIPSACLPYLIGAYPLNHRDHSFRLSTISNWCVPFKSPSALNPFHKLPIYHTSPLSFVYNLYLLFPPSFHCSLFLQCLYDLPQFLFPDPCFVFQSTCLFPQPPFGPVTARNHSFILPVYHI